jgi:hypothetical protein
VNLATLGGDGFDLNDDQGYFNNFVWFKHQMCALTRRTFLWIPHLAVLHNMKNELSTNPLGSPPLEHLCHLTWYWKMSPQPQGGLLLSLF